MLVLSRRVGERVLIGDSIVVTVVATRGGTIRIGVDAPRSVGVVREELAGPARGCRGPSQEGEFPPLHQRS